jgi:manganese/zinc/iron transport system permease protein
VSDDLVVILTGVAAAIACALPGTFLVLRGMSLIGDAISHAVLPGIVLAFLWSGAFSSWAVLIGAGALGLVTVWLIETLYRTRRVKEDASIAIVFPALFALGVLLVVQFTQHKDLDQDCVFYGEIAYAPLDTIVVGGLEVARPLLVLGIVALVNAGFILLLFKELKLSTFDSALAASLGLSPVVVHYLLMGSVSLTTVAAFESVGAILVVAFLIVPPAAAYLLTDRLGPMLFLSAGIGSVSAAGGYWMAAALDASVAGSMATAMGIAFGLVWLGAPRQGLLGRWLGQKRARDRFARALLLERLARAPANEQALAHDLKWPAERVAELLARLRRDGLVDGTTPTAAGAEFVHSVVA